MRTVFCCMAGRLLAGLMALVALMSCPGTSAQAADMFVASLDSNEILRFDSETGAFLGVFASGGGLLAPQHLAFGPDGNLYVASFGTQQIKKFDGQTGAFLSDFARLSGDGRPVSLAFAPDGTLMVGDSSAFQIARFSANGTSLGVFANNVNYPARMAFGPNGQLYVPVTNTNAIYRYQVPDTQSNPVFVPPNSTGLSGPIGVAFSPEGVLCVSNVGSASVTRFDASTGAYLGELVAPASGGLRTPGGLTFGPDGNLYVASVATNDIKVFNGATGAFLRSIGGGSLAVPRAVAFRRSLPPTELVVTSFGNGYRGNLTAIQRFQVGAGTFLGSLTSADMNGPIGITIGSDNNYYVASYVTNQVLRYSASGAYLGVFAQVGENEGPVDLKFGPDGNLYVSCYQNGVVKRFNGQNGAFLDNFIPPTQSGFAGMVFGSDGILYVSAFGAGRIMRFQSASGLYLGDLGPGGVLQGPDGLNFGPDGHLYVSNRFQNTVLRFNVTTGTLINAVFAPGSGGLQGPTGVGFGSDGVLYVSSSGTNSVKRYNGQTGQYQGEIGSPNYLLFPCYFVFRNPRPEKVRVTGTIQLQDCVRTAQPLLFDFRTLDGSAGFARLVVPAADGHFEIPNVPAKGYTLWVKGAKWLAATTGINAAIGDVNGILLPLLGGDANNDNMADALDLAALITAFNTRRGADDGYDEYADFNCDDAVDALDLAILISNFNTEGE